MNIEPPIYEKRLKKFLDVVNYFHDHIENHSQIVQPLQKMVKNYQPNKKLIWNNEAIQSFNNIKDAINLCPTLSFLDENAPIFLITDASDYGIGSYLYQLIDNKQQPIAFMSKLLSERENKWSTPEKECYAIFYSLVKFEYLLRDVHFCIRTDHKNLTFLNESANPKVNRWKMKIQHFDFDIEYIPGPDNLVADSFSRLIDYNEIKYNELNKQDGDNINIHEINVILDPFKLSTEVYKNISLVHNSVAGHHGVELTLKKLKDNNFNWLHMREHIKKFIKQCPCCQKMSVIKTPVHTHPFTTATYEPMERLNIDTIGPLEEDEFGNSYIIVIVDCFTRFIELFAVKDTSANLTANVLLNHFGRFGCPHQLLSDNGSQFVNNIIEELIKLIGTQFITTLAYSKEENAIVERANKEVLRHLRAIIFDKNIVHKWSKCLPFIQRIINSSVESSIGVNPASILFGNSINLDKGILLPLNNNNNNINNNKYLSTYTANLLKIQSDVIEAAKRNQQNKDENHLINADSQITEFENNSFVLVSYPISNLKKGPPNKLNTNLRGPLKVINHLGSTYILENLVTGKLENCHVTQLKNFNFDPSQFDPTDAANKDYFATVVDKILEHYPIKQTYKQQKVSEMQFKVRWKNLTSEFDRIIPWKELQNNPELHKYLFTNKELKHLIPREHRKNSYLNNIHGVIN